VIYCGYMANPTNTIDKRQVARSIRTLMDYAGINIEELGTLSASPASDDEEETRLSPEWEAMLQEARDEQRTLFDISFGFVAIRHVSGIGHVDQTFTGQ